MYTVGGIFYKSFDFERDRRYWTFLPTELNLLSFKFDEDVTDLLVQAHRSLGILEGMVEYIPNVESFLEMMLCRDIYYSCRIDEIITTYKDILMENDVAVGTKSALNCCKAFRSLPGSSFTKDWICNLQKNVMDGIVENGAGEIRKRAFLMHPHIIVNTQEYNPPPPEEIEDLLQDLIKYVAVDQSMDILIKVALLYYQFETIHPFDSGNGRVGRLLPVALLMKQEILSKGCLFISEYLYKNNDMCLELYRSVQNFGNYIDWIKFFLQCIIDSSNHAIKQLNAVVKERKEVQKKLEHNIKFLRELSEIYDFLEKKPIFMIKDLVDAFHISYNTASSRVEMLVKMRIVKQEKEQNRNRIFMLQRYLDVFIDNSQRGCISNN